MAKTKKFSKTKIIFQAKKKPTSTSPKYTVRLFQIGKGKKPKNSFATISQTYISSYSSLGVGVIFIIILLTNVIFKPKLRLQLILTANPHNLEANLDLADLLLAQNRYQDAEKILKISQQIEIENILSKNSSLSDRLQSLWGKKHTLDPQDILYSINQWEKIIKDKPNYRDGYIKLAILYLSLNQKKQALDNLNTAYGLDPNNETILYLMKIIGTEVN